MPPSFLFFFFFVAAMTDEFGAQRRELSRLPALILLSDFFFSLPTAEIQALQDEPLGPIPTGVFQVIHCGVGWRRVCDRRCVCRPCVLLVQEKGVRLLFGVFCGSTLRSMRGCLACKGARSRR